MLIISRTRSGPLLDCGNTNTQTLSANNSFSVLAQLERVLTDEVLCVIVDEAQPCVDVPDLIAGELLVLLEKKRAQQVTGV